MKANQSKPQISEILFNFVDLNFLLVMRAKAIRSTPEKLKLLRKNMN